jgi:hypothetical protein
MSALFKAWLFEPEKGHRMTVEPLMARPFQPMATRHRQSASAAS